MYILFIITYMNMYIRMFQKCEKKFWYYDKRKLIQNITENKIKYKRQLYMSQFHLDVM